MAPGVSVSSSSSEVQEVILISDPRVAAIAVVDNGEPLVDLRDIPEVCVDKRYADPAGDYAWVRKDVARRLLAAHSALPEGLRLLVTEGYRPPDRQQAIFDYYITELRRLNPQWSDDALYAETTKFVSPVKVAPHNTGGAVDLTLCTNDGIELDMGTPLDATPEESRNKCFTHAPDIPPQAQRNRRVLSDALSGAGLVNYPTGWWHWSYGERYWALTTGAFKAMYGPTSR